MRNSATLGLALLSMLWLGLPWQGQEPRVPDDIRDPVTFEEVRDLYKRYIEQLRKDQEQWEDDEVSGTDEEGRRATFKIRILSQEYLWSFRSIDEPIGGTEGIKELLQSENMQFQLATATDLICVGAASQEGYEEREAFRATRRAETLVSWTRNALPEHSNPPIHTLVLGRFKNRIPGLNHDQTSYQRRIVLIAVTEKQAHVILEEALKNALSGGSEGVPGVLGSYLSFKLNPMTGSLALSG